jgi:hypothetical protein
VVANTITGAALTNLTNLFGILGAVTIAGYLPSPAVA